MAASKPTQKDDEVPDANLLDEEDLDEVVVQTTYDYTFEMTPRSTGKDLRINSPHPVDMPKTPPATPPRQRSSAETSSPRASSSRINIPSGRHSTKLGIYLHTDRRPSLTKMITTHYACNPKFFTKTSDLERIVDRARFLLMNQEPYHTLLQEGCNINFVKPQISYKVATLEGNDLIDFVASLTTSDSAAKNVNPIPFYEFCDGSNFTQTDVSFLFKVEPNTIKIRPSMHNQSTATYDITTLSPLIDSIRNAAPTLQAAQRSNQPTIIDTSARPTLSLANTAPPRHIIMPAATNQEHISKPQTREPSTTSPERVSRTRPHDRLGPPVPHVFRDRSRSHEDRSRRHRDSREIRRRK
jgi:hypothetical protein